MVLFSQVSPTLNRFNLSQPPPQEFTRQQPKIFDRPRSQDNTPGRQFGLRVNNNHQYHSETCRHLRQSRCMYSASRWSASKWSEDGVTPYKLCDWFQYGVALPATPYLVHHQCICIRSGNQSGGKNHQEWQMYSMP